MSEEIMPIVFFERWLKVNTKSSLILNGQDLNSLLRTTWTNWWPFKSFEAPIQYEAELNYRISTQGVVIYRTIKELYGKA